MTKKCERGKFEREDNEEKEKRREEKRGEEKENEGNSKEKSNTTERVFVFISGISFLGINTRGKRLEGKATWLM